MTDLWNRTFNPSPEQRKQTADHVNKIIQDSLDTDGEDCTNCKHCKYVQVSPYSETLTCAFDTSIDIPWMIGEHHRCDKYEFIGFVSPDDFIPKWLR